MGILRLGGAPTRPGLRFPESAAFPALNALAAIVGFNRARSVAAKLDGSLYGLPRVSNGGLRSSFEPERRSVSNGLSDRSAKTPSVYFRFVFRMESRRRCSARSRPRLKKTMSAMIPTTRLKTAPPGLFFLTATKTPAAASSGIAARMIAPVSPNMAAPLRRNCCDAPYTTAVIGGDQRGFFQNPTTRCRPPVTIVRIQLAGVASHPNSLAFLSSTSRVLGSL